MAPSTSDYSSYGRSFINGGYVEKTEKTFPLSSPSTGKVIAEGIQEAGAKEVDEAVAAAKAAFPAWSSAHPSVRAGCLRKLAQLMRQNGDKLAELDGISMGKPVSAYGRELEVATKSLEHAANLCETFLAGNATTNTPGFLNLSLKVPYGVVAGICPWNVPLIMFAHKAGDSLAAGNCTIIKSSEKSPLSTSFVAGLTEEAGFPAGVLQVLTGAGLTGKLLAEHMEIRKISFTGSTRTGRFIQESSARSNLKDVVLELGGKSPSIVFDDADLDQAAQGLAASLWHNAGQIYMASTRVYVQESIEKAFLEKYKAALQQCVVGDPFEKTSMMGPLADATQMKIVESYLESGKSSGAKLALGGEKLDKEGFFVPPTIFTGVEHDAKINREEIFGPVAIVHTFTDEEEVLRRANDTEYGLYASVFTKNIDRAIRFAKGLDAGNVAVNCTSPVSSPDMEFGGTKMSGIGREGGPRALEQWLETKSVYIKTS